MSRTVTYDSFMDREARIRMTEGLAAGINLGTVSGLPSLRRIRRQKFRNQKAFCEQIGIDRTTYNSWETGRHWPSARILPILASALDCTIEDLYAPGEETEGEK